MATIIQILDPFKNFSGSIQLNIKYFFVNISNIKSNNISNNRLRESIILSKNMLEILL